MDLTKKLPWNVCILRPEREREREREGGREGGRGEIMDQ